MFTVIPRSNDRHGDFKKLDGTTSGRLDNFFEVPWGIELWRSQDVESISNFFWQASFELSARLENERRAAIVAFESSNLLKQAWLKLCGWKAPGKAPTRVEVFAEIGNRCLALAELIEENLRTGAWHQRHVSTFGMKVHGVIELMELPTLVAAA